MTARTDKDKKDEDAGETAGKDANPDGPADKAPGGDTEKKDVSTAVDGAEEQPDAPDRKTAPAGTTPARVGGRPLSRTGKWARGAIGLLVLGALLEVLGRADLVLEGYLPPTSEIVTRAAELAVDEEFVTVHLAATLSAWLLGLLLTIVIAVPLGLLLGSVPFVNTATSAVVEFLRPIPSVALIPLVAMMLGSGTEMKVALIVYAASWPVLFNTIYGLRDVDPIARDTLRTFGFGPFQVMLRASLPAAAPFIYTGIRLATSIALILAVGAEIISGFGEGIGIFIGQSAGTLYGTQDVLAGTVWAGCLGLLANMLLVWGERRLFGWHLERGRT